MASPFMVLGSNSANRQNVRSTPQGDYTLNPLGGATFTYVPGRAQEAADALGRSTGQVMGPVYDVGGGSIGGAGGGRSTISGGGQVYGGGFQTPGGDSIVTSAGSGGGDINLSRTAYERQQEMALKKKYADEAFAKITASAGGSGNPATVQYGNGAAGEAARASAFARAKEQAGANANAALKSMQDIMGRRGLAGSSIAAGAEGDVIASGGSDIANVITNQMQDELANIQHVNDITYQGGITQRGQDQAARNAYLSMLSNIY